MFEQFGLILYYCVENCRDFFLLKFFIVICYIGLYEDEVVWFLNFFFYMLQFFVIWMFL